MLMKMKKMVSLLTIVFMLASFTPVFADVVEDLDVVYDWDFTGATVDMTAKTVTKADDNSKKLILNNSNNYQVSTGTDATYGTTLVLTRTAKSARYMYKV